MAIGIGTIIADMPMSTNASDTVTTEATRTDTLVPIGDSEAVKPFAEARCMAVAASTATGAGKQQLC